MMAVAAGIAKTYSGNLLLAGGTQMLAVAAIIKSIGLPIPCRGNNDLRPGRSIGKCR